MSTLKYIIDTPMDQLKFEEFASLKSGRDKVSSMKLADIIKSLPDDTLSILAKEFTNDALKTQCMRWILRGLDIDKAMRKVKTDIQVSQNCIEKYYNKQLIKEKGLL